MNWLVAYVNETYGNLLKHPVTAETLRRWHGRGHIAELSEAGIGAAFAAHKIPPRRGRPKKQDAPEYIRIADIVHIPFVETLIEELAEIGEEAG